eukprot:7517469-Pyramimonas_sp.AAC.1
MRKQRNGTRHSRPSELLIRILAVEEGRRRRFAAGALQVLYERWISQSGCTYPSSVRAAARS